MNFKSQTIPVRLTVLGGFALLIFDILADVIFELSQYLFDVNLRDLALVTSSIQVTLISFALGAIALRREHSAFVVTLFAALFARLFSLPYNLPLLLLFKRFTWGHTWDAFQWATGQTMLFAALGGLIAYILHPAMNRYLFTRFKLLQPLTRKENSASSKPEEAKSSV